MQVDTSVCFIPPNGRRVLVRAPMFLKEAMVKVSESGLPEAAVGRLAEVCSAQLNRANTLTSHVYLWCAGRPKKARRGGEKAPVGEGLGQISVSGETIPTRSTFLNFRASLSRKPLRSHPLDRRCTHRSDSSGYSMRSRCTRPSWQNTLLDSQLLGVTWSSSCLTLAAERAHAKLDGNVNIRR